MSGRVGEGLCGWKSGHNCSYAQASAGIGGNALWLVKTATMLAILPGTVFFFFYFNWPTLKRCGILCS